MDTAKKFNPWPSFWQNQDIDSIWSSNYMTEIFFRRHQEILSFQKDDQVLDFGCGLGYFAYYFKDQVASIDGVDINSKYISYCKDNYGAGSPSLNFYQLKESDYTNLEVLGEKTFTKCIIGSVVQYFDNQQHLYNLIDEIYQRRDERRGITILILDLPTELSNTLKDVCWQLYWGIRYNYLRHVTQALFRAFFSQYRKIRNKHGLLQINRSELKNFLSRKDCSYQLTKTILTLNSSREHVLINYFP